MIIAHVSDQHSLFPKLPKEAELVINTGDWLPNKTRGYRDVEPTFQLNWIKQNLEKIKTWLDGRTMLFSAGNHDFLRIEAYPYLFKSAGINIIDITLRSCIYPEFNIHGFPYIPYISGEWNFELRLPEMVNELQVMDDRIQNFPEWKKEKFSILACHAPPYGILDKGSGTLYRENLGNRALSNWISFDKFKTRFDLIVCGHIHESSGISDCCGIPVVNSATTVHRIKLGNNKILGINEFK